MLWGSSSYGYFRSLRLAFTTQVRHRHKKERPSVLAKKKYPIDKALEHFDDFYKNVFGTQWKSVRLALLSRHKYCAVVNNFGDTEQTISNLQNLGALNMKTLYELEKGYLMENEDLPGNNEDSEKIFKLDQQMERVIHSKQEEEFESVYPSGESSPRPLVSSEDAMIEKHTDTLPVDNIPLVEHLRDAEMDESRIIDPGSGLSSASLFEFVPATKLKGMEDWVLESEHYNYYKRTVDFPVHVKKEYEFNFPEHLELFVYERGNVSTFPPPKRSSTGVLDYFLMDGGSVLPVLALDLKPGDAVLDMCAAPGGKSLVMLQTLYPGHLVCNDFQESRTNRIHSILKQYLYDLDKWRDQVIVTQNDGRHIGEQDTYDKVLVDVPCTTDRHSLNENDNNIFNPMRTKERLKLPETQAQLLSSALKLVKPGGTVVYSTCSLSPIQNDGVVHMALRTIWEESKIQLEVRDLSPVLGPFQNIYKFGHDVGLRYGHLVLPFLPCNFGPMYFCKIVRIS